MKLTHSINGIKLKCPIFFAWLFVLVIVTQSNIVFSQDNNVVVKIGNERFIMHKVEEGHTLYAISKKYSVPISSIVRQNPDVEAGIKIGQIIKVPVSEVNKKESKNAPKLEGNFLKHKVAKKETLFSISRKYKVDINDIMQANPGSDAGISTGQELLIPVEKVKNANPNTIRPAFGGNDTLITHYIKPGETLFSLSQVYEVTIDSIVLFNKKLKDAKEVKVGDTLYHISPDTVESMHVLNAGETLYALSRKYDVSIDQIKKQNNIADQNAMRIGDTLKVSKITLARVPHRVRFGETIKTIAEKYSLSQDSLIVLNDFVNPSKLMVGDSLKIPVSKDNIADFESIDVTGKTEFKDKYNVAIMLPFFVDEHQRVFNNPKVKDYILPQSVKALEFYQGVLIAIDSLRKEGLSINLHVFDTQKDSLKILAILRKPEMKEMDLIIGPMFSSSVKHVAKFAKENGIHIVAPVANSEELLDQNPFLSKAKPSHSTQLTHLAGFIARHYSDQNVLLIKGKTPDQKSLLEGFRRSYWDSLKVLKGDSAIVGMPVLSMGENSIDTIATHFTLDSTKMNVLVLPSRQLPEVSHLFTMLSTLDSLYMPCRFTIFGLEDWEGFSDIDLYYKRLYNMHFVSSVHLDEDNPSVNEFVKKYQKQYNGTQPGLFAFRGFDVSYYYLRGLLQFGTGFHQWFNSISSIPLMSDYKFLQPAEGSGYENIGAFVLRYEGFKLIKVN